jgi:flavorubredoxin
MFTYVPEEKLLFSMDAFGQHYASEHRFDDEEPLDIIMQDAKIYYANIIMHLGKQIAKVLEKASAIEINMIAPSHGVIWRKNLDVILSSYNKWIECKAEKKVLVIYSTMWQSTEKMAYAIADGAAKNDDVSVKVLNIKANHITTIATEVLDAAAIAFGSPTLNMSIMPEAAQILTYLRGLKPANKSGIAFGSYGWAKAGSTQVEEYMKEMKINILSDPIVSQFSPTPEILDECRKAGELLADTAQKA